MSNNESFSKLQKEWYDKLKNSGFEDIEGSNGALKVWASSYHRIRLSKSFGYKEAYFDKAREFLHTHHFADRRDRLVWEMHCEGVAIRDIVDKLKKKKIKAYKFLIEQIMGRLKKDMLIWIGNEGDTKND